MYAMRSYKKRIGALIRRERKRHDWSQNDLARQSGLPLLTAQQVSRWETGDAMPNEDNFAALEQAFGVLLIPDVEDEDEC